jgi:hypothetical protein
MGRSQGRQGIRTLYLSSIKRDVLVRDFQVCFYLPSDALRLSVRTSPFFPSGAPLTDPHLSPGFGLAASPRSNRFALGQILPPDFGQFAPGDDVMPFGPLNI